MDRILDPIMSDGCRPAFVDSQVVADNDDGEFAPGIVSSILEKPVRCRSYELPPGDYIELATTPDFMETFTEALYLGKYRIKKGKREEVN